MKRAVEYSRIVIFGMGVTGLACARYFLQQKKNCVVLDTRRRPDLLADFQALSGNIDIQTETLNGFGFSADDYVLVSPGIALTNSWVVQAGLQGACIGSDIEVFMQQIEKPVIAITGSNGKTTVTRLVEVMLNHVGITSIACGNIGKAVLDVLFEARDVDAYILELSSFQLERIQRLGAHAVCILNITEDHLDRYDSFADYAAAKQVIFTDAKYIISPWDDVLCRPINKHGDAANDVSYGFDARADIHAVKLEGNDQVTVFLGGRALLNTEDLLLNGRHNISNVMAAFALCCTLTDDVAALMDSAANFSGLAHRCQWIADVDGVSYLNDSKATNVGACVAAIDGFHQSPGRKNIILIAGGQDKNSDFSPLLTAVRRSVKAIILLGADAEKIQKVLASENPYRVTDLKEAVSHASQLALAGDTVLFSPACASFDMFDNYEARGNAFVAEVRNLIND